MMILCSGCRKVTESDRSGKCPSCRLEANRRRESNPLRKAFKAARYSGSFKQARREIQEMVKVTGAVCWRCEGYIPPGGDVDCDHHPNGSIVPTHPACNRGKRVPA